MTDCEVTITMEGRANSVLNSRETLIELEPTDKGTGQPSNCNLSSEHGKRDHAWYSFELFTS